MEKRKTRIFSHFEDILDEKNTLEENLNKVIDHVFSCVDQLKKNSEEVKQKDCSLILSYVLEIFKKLTEINYDLENIIDESPLKSLKITEKKYVADIKAPEINENMGNNSEVLELTNCVSSQQIDSPVDSLVNVAACSSFYISEIISSNCNTEIGANFSDHEIQKEFRDTLQKFSKKLGLNAESISCMKDYYEKPSVSGVKEIVNNPSSSQNPLECSMNYGNTSSLETNSNGEFDIPEKDTNNVNNCKSDFQDSAAIVELPLKTLNLDMPSSTVNFKIENESDDSISTVEPSTKIIFRPDTSSSSDLEIFSCKSDDSSSNEILIKDSQSHGHTTDPPYDLLPSATDDSSKKTEESDSDLKTISYTALEKLNNTKFLDKKQEACDKAVLPHVPNLKLIPSETAVIKNDLEEKNKLKKKKNKKGKSEVKDECLYELYCKTAPKVGTECVFSHIESPSEFYIHIVDEESALIDTLTEILNSYFSGSTSKYPSKDEASVNIGTYCCAFLTKYNGWYRAKILNWHLESKSESVEIQLVDYGDKCTVSYKNLRKMIEEMVKYPMLAIRCHLPLMYPPGSTYLNRLTEWPPGPIEALVELGGLFVLDEGKNKFFTVVYAQEEEHSVAIDLYNPKEADPEHTVGQILLDLGLAEQIIEEPDADNMEVEEFLQDIDTLERADNINEAIIGYDPRDEARICRFTKPDGTCFKGKNCKLEHVPLSRDGFTTDQEPVFTQAMDTLLLPSNGDVIILLITGYKDACNFYAQIVRNPHKEKHGSREYAIDSELYSLLGTMNNKKVTKTYETFKVSPAIGEVVIAKHKSIKKWLRAIVRERFMWNDDESVEYQVFLVDFGEYMQLPLSDLRKIKPQFLQLPFQVIECYIHNYKAKKDCDKKKVEEFFYKNMLYHNFVAVTMSSSLPLKVGIKTFNGIDIGKVLVDTGFAEKREHDTNPVNGCPLELY